MSRSSAAVMVALLCSCPPAPVGDGGSHKGPDAARGDTGRSDRGDDDVPGHDARGGDTTTRDADGIDTATPEAGVADRGSTADADRLDRPVKPDVEPADTAPRRDSAALDVAVADAMSPGSMSGDLAFDVRFGFNLAPYQHMDGSFDFSAVDVWLIDRVTWWFCADTLDSPSASLRLRTSVTSGQVTPGVYTLASGSSWLYAIYRCAGNEGCGEETTLEASAGTVTLTQVDSDGVVGSYHLSFPGHDGGERVLSGDFSVPSCVAPE